MLGEFTLIVTVSENGFSLKLEQKSVKIFHLKQVSLTLFSAFLLSLVSSHFFLVSTVKYHM